jgi:hypothetical protein
MLTLPPRACMTAGRADRRRAQRLRWNTKQAKEKYHALRQGAGAYVDTPLPEPVPAPQSSASQGI